MGRSFLSVTLAVATAAGATVACRVPDTLGLPCVTDVHCDGDQVCRDGVCAQPSETTGEEATTGGPDPSTTSGIVQTSSSGDDGPADTSTGSPVGSTSDTTGGACGVGSCIDLDVLVVLDNSPSMYQWLLPIANSLDSLVTLITSEFAQVCSWHVGVTTSDPDPSFNGGACDVPGALVQVPEHCSAELAGHPWIGSRDIDVQGAVQVAKCVFIDSGAGGPNDEVMLESMMGALDPAMSAAGACNQGFRRDDANLLILYVSDEDDPTAQSDLVDLAEQFEMWVDGSSTAFIGLVADNDFECPWMNTGNDSDGSGAQVPSKLNGFLALTSIPLDQRATVDICEMAVYEFDPAFGVVAATCGGL